jgi:hypothetical protein
MSFLARLEPELRKFIQLLKFKLKMDSDFADRKYANDEANF